MTKKRCDWGFFFFHFSKNGQYFPTKKKKKLKRSKKLRLPSWPQLRPPAGPETDFLFKGGLMCLHESV